MSNHNTHEIISDVPSVHSVDGITEYDNPLPGWWKWLWVGTIAFSGCYLLVAAISNGQMSPVATYDQALVDAMKNSGGPLAADAPTLVRLMKDEDTMRDGAAIFAANCVACHGRDASGILGPNLTDDYYINVRKIDDIPDVVTKGRKSGAMPAWGNRLSHNEIVTVAAYVASLRGQNKPGRPHEGQIIPAWNGVAK